MALRLALRRALVIAGASAGIWLALGHAACVSDPPGLPIASGTTGGTPTGSGGGSGSNHGAEMFAELAPDLLENCGTCHEPGGIADMPFLDPADPYASISSWPGIIVKDPTQSKLLTWPRKGGSHMGTNIDADELVGLDLPGRILAWLTEEAKARAGEGTAGPQLEPITPILGFNAVYLDELGEEFTGMALTFTAAELDPTTLQLTELQVHPTASVGLHVVHPLFAVYAGGEPDPDPVDSFSNVDEYVEAGDGKDLGPGTAILTNWKTGGKIAIAFEKIEPFGSATADGGTEGGTTGACKDLTTFTDVAQAAFQNNCANACHGGTDPMAKAAIDMSKLGTNPSVACGQIRNRVNPDEPAKSQIFVTTDPNGNATHPFKFMGDAGSWNDFMSTVTPWIQAEK